jgi:DNA polymerase-1
MAVSWDTLETPTYRHEKFPASQSGREFDDAVVEQLEVLPEFVVACGFQNAKEPGFEADDFLAAAALRPNGRLATKPSSILSPQAANRLSTRRPAITQPSPS